MYESFPLELISPFIQIILQGGLPRDRCDKSFRAVFQNSTCDIDFNKSTLLINFKHSFFSV